MRKLCSKVATFVVLALSSGVAIAAGTAPPAPTASATAAPADASAQPAQPPGPPLPRHKPDPKDEPFDPHAPIAPLASAAAPAAPAKVAALPIPRAKPATPTLVALSTKPVPRPKPALVPAAVVAHAAQAAVPVAAPLTAPVTTPPVAKPKIVALSKPFPRPKPTIAPVAVVAPTAPVVEVAAPVVPATPQVAGACGDACNEILFKTIGDCLWVQNANPRAVTFAAQVAGRPVVLALAGADAAKADAHLALEPKDGAPPAKDEAAYQTRISDPFSPSAPGIAVYRARVGPASTCAKSRTDLTSFTASFVKPTGSR